MGMVVEVDMAVIGAGPGGLILAKGLAEKGFSVALVEKREHAIRGQIMTEYLPSLKAAVWEQCRIPLPKQDIQLKDVERLAMQVVQLVAEPASRRARFVAKSKIRLYRPYEAIAIDRTVNTVRLKPTSGGDEVMIRYRHIFCCGGARRPALNLIADQPIRYTPTDLQMPESRVGVMQLQLPERCRDNPALLSKIDTDMPSFGEAFHFFGTLQDPDSGEELRAWDRPYLPTIHLKNHPHQHKITLVCSLPDIIVNQRDPDKKRRLLLAWGKKLAFWKFRKYARLELKPGEISASKPSTKYGAKKDALRALTTELHFDFADKMSFKLNDEGEGYCVVIGDAYATIPYMKGEGSAVAMWQALFAIQHIEKGTGKFDAEGCQFKTDKLMRSLWNLCNGLLLKEQDNCIDQMKRVFNRALVCTGISAPSLRAAQRGMALLALYSKWLDCVGNSESGLYLQAMTALLRVARDVRSTRKVTDGVRSLLQSIKQKLLNCEGDVPFVTRIEACKKIILQLSTLEHQLDRIAKSRGPLHTPAEVEVWRKAGYRIGDDEIPVLIGNARV
ncbi:MAG: FAD-dependent oxidoreductase [Coxiellaceae bacterium]|nr:FAD-dependent oxidoreductase [Coxiellaceae bacterium]